MIKRSHLTSSLFLVSLISLVLSAIVLSDFYGVRREKADALWQQTISAGENSLKDSVNTVINSIENDILICEEGFVASSDISSQHIPSSIDCNTYVKAITQRRIGGTVFVSGGRISVKQVVNYEGGENYAFYIADSLSKIPKQRTLSTSSEHKSGTNPYLTELNGINTEEEVLYRIQSQSDSTTRNSTKLAYAKLIKKMDWIVTADKDIDTSVYEIADGPVLKKYFFSGSAINIIVFLLLSLFIISLIYKKYGKILSKNRQKTRAEYQELRDKNIALAEQVKAQRATIRESENSFKALFHAADNVGFILTRFVENGPVIVDVNSGIEKMLGYRRSELIGRNPTYLHSPELVDDLNKMLWQKQSLDENSSGEIVLLKKNNESLPVAYSNQPRYNAAGVCSGVISIVLDMSALTELRKTLNMTEDRLQQAQKMEAIGTLAGGIAHDFNNVLSSIVGYSELVKEQLSPQSQAYMDLEQVLTASTRAANLVKQILAFSRKRNMENSYFEPAIIVKETLKMLRSTIPATIEIQENIEAEGLTIYANSTQFHQVFMNLSTNAYQAMEPGGGVLSVSLKKISVLENIPEGVTLQGDDFLELIVADMGGGIAPEIRDRVFEPFFSTKDSSTGTGMGLSTVHTIVTKSGGAIWFNDGGEKGTEFHVVLPVRDEKADREETSPASALHRGNERILFIDDEPEIAAMAKAILESLGYSVQCYTSSLEAFENFLEDPQKFDLIITDQTMPEMTGAELAQKVREISTTLPIILCTGYSARISEENWMRHGVNGFIMKPFRKVDIARLIRETLESANAPNSADTN